QIDSQVPLPDPLTLLGQVQTTPAGTTVALSGDLAYVGGTNGIDVVDISNSANPRVLNTFASNKIVKCGFTAVRQDTIAGTNYLLVGTTTQLNASGFTILIYALSDPVHPTLVSTTPIHYAFITDMLVQGNTILVPTDGINFWWSGDIFNQFGSVLSI